MTKIPSVEKRIEELFGKDPLRSRSFENQIRKAFIAERTALLTELREWSEGEPTINGMMLKARLLARIDELIKSNNV